MKQTKHKTEVDLAEDVIVWLKGRGWDCYSEVYVPGGPCDIIAVKEKHVWAIECKLTLSWHLLTQAWRHVEKANRVSIAIPYMKTDWNDRQTIHHILTHLGVGLITARHGETYERITESPGPFHAVNTEHYRGQLTENHKTFAKAGSNRGYWTPFKGVAEAVAIFVRDNPGCTLKELIEIEAVKKYYQKPSQAKSNLRAWISRQVIKHIRCEDDHGKTRFFPFDPANEPRI